MQRESGMGWGVPVVLAAAVLIAGLLFYNTRSDRTTTASNERAPITSNAPAPAPQPPPAAPKTQ